MTEREIFLTSLLNCRRVDLYADEVSLTTDQKEAFEKMLSRRLNHEPVQYIVGKTQFMKLNFYVNTDVLIPRPETELLVEAILQKAQKLPKPVRILDVGTGCGNIIISLAKYLRNSSCFAVDISPKALMVAEKNAKLHGVSQSIHFCESDLFFALEDFSSEDKKFDIIVSNPPYIAAGQLRALPLDVQKEPSLALDGGVDGLEFYRRIINDAGRFLKTGGFLCFELGDGQADSVQEILKQENTLEMSEIYKDYTDTVRILIARKKDE